MKKIIFSGVDFEVAKEYARQIQEFFGNLVLVEGIVIDEIDSTAKADLLVVSSELVKSIVVSKTCWKNDNTIVVLKSVFSKEQLRQIESIKDKKALLVAHYRSYVMESLIVIEESLKRKMNIIPYYQDVRHMPYEGYDYAIFIGDERIIPHGVKNLMEIGCRIISHHTYNQIIDILKFDSDELKEKIKIHMIDMPDISFERLQTIQLISESRKVFDKLFDYVIDKGIIHLDYDDKIADYNEYVCNLLGVKRDIYTNRKIENVEIFNNIYKYLKNVEEDISVEIEINGLSILGTKKIVRFQHIEFQKFIVIEKKEKFSKYSNIKAKYTFNDIISVTKPMKNCVYVAKKVAKIESPVLILGETGTGKELLAQALHNESPRCNKPFIALNCTTLQESLLTSELFGYEKGTFTGALSSGKKGIFEIADGGTVFLDEIGDAPLNVQLELLRVLEEKEIRRIGGEEMIPINVRVISATNRNLYENVKKGKFRKDLFYRLSTFIIEIPPLRERRGDIKLLADYFLKKEGYFYKKVEKEVYDSMDKLEWEGNIRELRNFVSYMGYMSEDIITIDHIPTNYKKMLDNIPKKYEKENILYFNDLGYKDNIIALEILRELKWNSKGRNALLENIRKVYDDVSSYDIRKILDYLSSNEYIFSGKGRKGSSILEKGIKILGDK